MLPAFSTLNSKMLCPASRNIWPFNQGRATIVRGFPEIKYDKVGWRAGYTIALSGELAIMQTTFDGRVLQTQAEAQGVHI